MWRENLINAKYHLSVARRLFESYEEYGGKRFLVGVINENARAAASVVRAFLIVENVVGKDSRKNLGIFIDKVAPKYLSDEIVENLVKSLEVERAQKKSPIEYARADRIVLLIDGKYRFLTANRLREFMTSVEESIFELQKKFRQV